jgi:hypothetical protein
MNSINHYLKLVENVEIYYFVFDFEPIINIPKVKTIRMKSINTNVFYNMKPLVLQMALKILPHFIFVDSDTLPSRRFDYESMISSVHKYPKANYLPSWKFPEYWYINDKGERISYDHSNLSNKMGVIVGKYYLQGCLYGLNQTCSDFVDEWVDILMDGELLKEGRKYFPLGDETVYNILLWKYSVEDYFYNQIVFEPKTVSEYSKVEFGTLSDSMVENTYCYNSETTQIYHQIKDINLQNGIIENYYLIK